MRLSAIALTTLLATTFAMPSVVYADEQTDKQAIVKAYRSSNEGLQHKDVNQLTANYAPEFTSIGKGGESTNLTQLRQFWQENFKVIRLINQLDDIQEIQINGQTAKVTGIGYSSAIVFNPKKPGVLVPRASVSKYQDIWKRTNNGWKIISSHTLDENVSWGSFAQGTQNNLTPQQRHSLNQQKRMEQQQIIDIMKTRQDMMNCMSGTGYGCGSSIVGN